MSGNEYLSDSIISIGTSPGNRAGSSETFSRMKRIFENCQDIRRMGAASLELCYVACGRLDGFFEEHLKPWDYAAGMLVVEEAGGRALNRYGRMLTLRPDGEVLATNGRITEEILKFL